MRARTWVLVTVVLGPLLAGCGNSSPSSLDPEGPKARAVTFSWWILFAVAAFVCVVVSALALRAVISRRGEDTEVKRGDGTKFVVILGLIIPAVILMGTFALSVGTLAANSKPPRETKLTVEVIGHRWWWEVRYPDGEAVTANEIHIPVDTPVLLRLQTADVIHSFWVPELMPKIDLLPRRVNESWISAEKVGTYRGQCAEYCGEQHAHMAFLVIAEPQQEFEQWLAGQNEEAQPPDTELERVGLSVIENSTCGTCHTVRGTSADGDVGPDLTHVGSRRTLAAGAIPNDFGHMAGWVSNSQTVKPGNLMPPQQQLSPEELRGVVTYLQGLK
jgi:cytochrome c oxidase subunit 2